MMLDDRPISRLQTDDRGAEISDDGIYRYTLWRRWDKERPRALFVMLNPSTADADRDDPTIRRCVGFARSWGMGGLRVVNLYPFRATKPADLWKADVPEGYGNLNCIERMIDTAGISVAAWGAHGPEKKTREVRNLFYDLGVPLYALGLTNNGAPRHPLYIAAAAIPIVFEPSRNNIRVGEQWTQCRSSPAETDARVRQIIDGKDKA